MKILVPVIALLTASLAPAELTYGLAPAMVIQEFKPGIPLVATLLVSNNSSSPVLFRGTTTDFWYDPQNEKIFPPPGSTARSASNWIEFIPRSLVVPAHGSANVKAVITPPSEVSGGYYAIAFLESKPELSEAASATHQAVFTNVRLGSLFMLTAEGSAHYQIAVSPLKIEPPDSQSALKVSFSIENKSNTHVFPRTLLAVVDDQKQLVAKAEGTVERFLPGQSHDLTVSWSGHLPEGKYTALLTILYGKNSVETSEIPFEVPSHP